MADNASLENPILNSPYDPPGQYFVIGPHGPTGETKPGRRPSESFIPVPVSRKRKDVQQSFDFDTTSERREVNTLINDIRREVERWRANKRSGVMTEALSTIRCPRPPVGREEGAID